MSFLSADWRSNSVLIPKAEADDPIEASAENMIYEYICDSKANIEIPIILRKMPKHTVSLEPNLLFALPMMKEQTLPVPDNAPKINPISPILAPTSNRRKNSKG